MHNNFYYRAWTALCWQRWGWNCNNEKLRNFQDRVRGGSEWSCILYMIRSSQITEPHAAKSNRDRSFVLYGLRVCVWTVIKLLDNTTQNIHGCWEVVMLLEGPLKLRIERGCDNHLVELPMQHRRPFHGTSFSHPDFCLKVTIWEWPSPSYSNSKPLSALSLSIPFFNFPL